MVDKSLKAVKYRLPFFKRRFGVREVDGAPQFKIDAVIAPVLGVGEGGKRIGWGAGFYDRFLSMSAKNVRIWVSFNEMRGQNIAQDHDAAADFYITAVGGYGRNGWGDDNLIKGKKCT